MPFTNVKPFNCAVSDDMIIMLGIRKASDILINKVIYWKTCDKFM